MLLTRNTCKSEKRNETVENPKSCFEVFQNLETTWQSLKWKFLVSASNVLVRQKTHCGQLFCVSECEICWNQRRLLHTALQREKSKESRSCRRVKYSTWMKPAETVRNVQLCTCILFSFVLLIPRKTQTEIICDCECLSTRMNYFARNKCFSCYYLILLFSLLAFDLTMKWLFFFFNAQATFCSNYVLLDRFCTRGVGTALSDSPRGVILWGGPLSDPGGAPAPLAPKISKKIMQFSGNFKGKNPFFEQILGSGPPLGSKLCWAPADQNPGSTPGGYLKMPHWSSTWLTLVTAQNKSPLQRCETARGVPWGGLSENATPACQSCYWQSATKTENFFSEISTWWQHFIAKKLLDGIRLCFLHMPIWGILIDKAAYLRKHLWYIGIPLLLVTLRAETQ